MKCQKCGNDFLEKELDESHDVPCYMFSGKDRQEKKQKADKYDRHILCRKCHDIYERVIISVMVNPLPDGIKQVMRIRAEEFAKEYFKKEGVSDERD